MQSLDENMTKIPKLLPWIARKTGISDEQAAALWSKAVRRATLQTGSAATPDHYRAAMQYLHELVERERAVG
jgi:hypothetical protein